MCKVDLLNRTTTTKEHILLLIRTSAIATILALLGFSAKVQRSRHGDLWKRKRCDVSQWVKGRGNELLKNNRKLKWNENGVVPLPLLSKPESQQSIWLQAWKKLYCCYIYWAKSGFIFFTVFLPTKHTSTSYSWPKFWELCNFSK